MPEPSQTESKSPRILALGVGCLGAVGLLLAPLPFHVASPVALALHDALHFPMFAVLVIGLHWCLKPRKNALLESIGIALVLAVGSELAQLGSGRTASWTDFSFDCIGIAVGAITILLLRGPKFRFKEIATVGATWVLASGAVLTPVAFAASAPAKFRRTFPVMGNFEDSWELKLWHPQGEGGELPVRLSRVQSHVTKGEYALEVDSQGSTWAGTHLRIPPGVSWAGYDALEFDLYSPTDTFELGIRIDCADGRRLTSAIQIVPGANSCTTPISELEDGKTGKSPNGPLEVVERVVLHFGPSPSDRTITIDRVELVKY